MRTAMRQMMGVFAQLERGMIATRLRAGRRLKREQGGYADGAPGFGYRRVEREQDGRKVSALDEDETDQKALARMRELRGRIDPATGKPTSYRAIVAALKAEGIPTKRGRDEWTAASVRRVLTREGSRDTGGEAPCRGSPEPGRDDGQRHADCGQPRVGTDAADGLGPPG
jgi:hypothetical protein